MAKGGMNVEFNQDFFDKVLKEPAVDELCETAAKECLQIAQALAPVDTGAYRRGLHVEKVEFAYRNAYQVVGDDWKTMIIEARNHVLANAMRQVR